jgi:DnaA-homolog protein
MLESVAFGDSNEMQQLPLEISPGFEPSVENFIPGANAEALARVTELAAGTLPEAVLYLWGEAGCGRTHLLRAAARLNASLVVADDVEALATEGQQALFLAINAARDGTAGRVLAAGDAPPALLRLREDLRTRLGWGLVYHLKPLADEDKARYLQAEAARRGLRLSSEVAWHLLNHLPRDLARLSAVLDALDRYSLSTQRPITVPLVREALAALRPRNGP